MPRSDVRFPSGTDSCAAWLHRPDGAEGRLPCVVMAHGFAGTRGARLDAYAERFEAAGYAVLLFDYRHFGDSGGQPRQLLSIGRQLTDWRNAVAYARSLDGIDPARIALWGTSFSGGHVVAVAAKDPQVKAVISQAPFMDGIATLRENAPAQVLRLTAAGLKDVAAMVRGREPVTIPAVGPPGSVAFMTTPDAEPGYLSIVPDEGPWENRAAARVGLVLGGYRPGAKAGRLRCPWLVQIADRDAITPPGPAAAAAEKAPQGEVRRYDAGHFEVYTGELFERVVADQLAFLERAL